MNEFAANQGHVFVRLEATSGRAHAGELRLLEPLREVKKPSDAMTLPMIDSDLSDAAVKSIHGLHFDLADSNTDLVWWYLPVTEWQPNMSALPSALDLAMRLEMLARGNEGRFVLTVPSPIVARYLEDHFLAHTKISLRKDVRSRLVWGVRRAKNVVLRYVNATAWLVENMRNYKIVRRARRAPAMPGRIDTLFISRIEAGFSSSADGVWRDTYLGALPEEGHARTGSVALLLRNGGDAGVQVKSVAGFHGFPVALISEFLTWHDIWISLRRAMRFRLANPIELSALGRAAVSESRSHIRALADWLVVELAISNFLRTTSVRQIVCMQENSNWEFSVARAAATCKPSPKTVGFFHCPVMPSAQRYRLRDDIVMRRPNFNETITLGRAMRVALLKLGDWISTLSDRHYAFRNPDLAGCLALPIRSPGSPLRLLVVLGGVFDNGLFLAWIKRATSSIDHLTIIVKPHPSFDYRLALEQADIDLKNGRFVLSTHRAMDLALSEADVLLYKGTTVCFAALAAGIPAIHVDDGGIGCDNALFDAGDLAISVDHPDFLVREIEKIRTQTDQSRELWAERARSYVCDYYDLSTESRDAALTRLFPKSSTGTRSAAASTENVGVRYEIF